MRVLGSVDPGSVPTSDEQTITVGRAPTGGTFTLTFEGQTTAAIPYDAASQTVHEALEALPGKPQVGVEGPAGGLTLPISLSMGSASLRWLRMPLV